jgi:anti-anti-sigma factor
MTTTDPPLVDEIVVVTVTGEVDISTAGLLRDQLADVLATQPGAVLVDVTRLDFCDLSGLDALVEAASAAASAGLELTLQGSWPGCSTPLRRAAVRDWRTCPGPSQRPDRRLGRLGPVT